jgi:hypothetical protein
MRDLEQLIRYEIPGFLIIVYFFLFSWDIIMELQEQKGVCYGQLVRVLPALVAAAAVLALSLGYLAFSFYFSCEEREFLKKRVGIRKKGIVERILEDYPASAELKWWKKRKKKPSVRNEILDIVFYNSNNENESTHILERFINFYHSRRVIGVYVPVFAVILHLFFASYVNMDFKYFLSISAVTIILYVIYYKITLIKIPDSKFYFIIGISLIMVILFILNFYPIKSIYYLFFLFIVWLITVPKTLENGMLKKRIDELEKNILLLRQREIVEAIRRRI